mgnify:CR=1 FL=1
MRPRAYLVAAGVALALAPATVAAQPRITSLLNDTADVLPADQEAQLLNKLETHHASTGVPIAVLTVQTTGGERIEDFSLRVATQWRQSFPGAVNAVLYTIAVRDHHHRIEVTDGLRPRLTATRAQEILDTARPSLRSGDYVAAIRTVLDGVAAATYAVADPNGNNAQPAPVAPSPTPVPAYAPPTYTPPPMPSTYQGSGDNACAGFACIGFVLLAVGLFISLLVRAVGRSVSRATGGVGHMHGGTTYGHGGSSWSHDHDTSSAWSSSSYDSSSSSFSSTDYSSGSSTDYSSSSTDYSSGSSGGSDFSGGGASSDW